MRPHRKPLNIIFTDDDADDRKFFTHALDEIGIVYAIRTFSNGRELLGHLQLEDVEIPDIVFLDLNMPIMNGNDCLREIREMPKYKDLSIAIYSTSSKDNDIEDAFVAGANVFIKKPNDFSNLVDVLKRILDMNWHYYKSNLNRETFFISV